MPDPHWFKAGTRITRSIGYNAGAPLVLTMMPAGHSPGLYLLSLSVVVRTAAATGTLTRSYGYSTPTAGDVTIGGFNASAITATGHPNGSYTMVSAYSDGVSPLTVTLTPASITGSPVCDVTAGALFVGS